MYDLDYYCVCVCIKPYCILLGTSTILGKLWFWFLLLLLLSIYYTNSILGCTEK